MFKTRITEMLGIEHPIIQGGMAYLSKAELASAVSNAGGLGVLTSADFTSADELRAEVKRTKELTDKPFGVNINLFPAVIPRPNDEFIDVLIEEGVKVVETSGVRSPEEFVGRLKEAGIKLIHKVAGVRYARKAEEVGADATTVVGVENGGAVGFLDITTFCMVPMAVDAVKIPVIAGGGIADARGFLAALALGAEGVVMGTRFLATNECPTHPRFKQWVVNSQETDTVLAERTIGNPHRCLRNKVAERVLEMETRGTSFKELYPLVAGDNFKKVALEGDLEAGIAYCGQAVGLVREVNSVKEMIDGIIGGAEDMLECLNRFRT
ncbi:NAD(P)H-dependent flavin oxidoreductase [Chloroflexota bacterium]